MPYILYFYLILVFIICKTEATSYQIANSGVPLLFDDQYSWMPTGVPASGDSAAITINGSSCYSYSPITVTNITVGVDSSTTSSFETNSSITFSFLDINQGSVFTLNPTTSIQILAGIIRIRGDVHFTNGSTCQVSGSLGIFSTGKVTIDGVLNLPTSQSGVGQMILNPNSTFNVGGFINNGSLTSYGELNSASYLISFTYANFFSSKVTANSMIYFSSTAPATSSIENSSFKVQGNFSVVNYCNFIFKDSDLVILTLNGVEYTDTFSNNYNSLFLSSVNSTIINSNLTSTKMNVYSSGFVFSFINSTFANEGMFVFQEYSSNTFTDSVITCGYMFSFNESTVLFENSQVNIIDQYFGSFQNSSMTLRNTELNIVNYISNKNLGYSGMGVFGNSTIILESNSIFNLNADYPCLLYTDKDDYNQGRLIIQDSSTYNIFRYFCVLNETKVIIRNNSTFSIRNQTTFTDNSNLYVESSFTNLQSNLIFSNQTTFSFINSNIQIDGSFIYNSDSLTTSQLSNTTAIVKGQFINGGKLDIENSIIQTYSNFMNNDILTLSNSVLMINNGLFYSSNQFIGHDSIVTMSNGAVSIDIESSFTCTNCIFKILGGHFKQNLGTSVELFNSTFTNTAGVLDSYGNLIINGNYTQLPDAEIKLSVDSLIDSNQSLVLVAEQTSFDGLLTVRVNKELLELNEDHMINLMAYNNSTGDFNQVIILTYNKDTGEETEMSPDCKKIQYQKSEGKLALLLNPSNDSDACNPKSSNQISKATLIGLVIGLSVAAMIGGVVMIIHFKSLQFRIFYLKFKSLFQSSTPGKY